MSDIIPGTTNPVGVALESFSTVVRSALDNHRLLLILSTLMCLVIASAVTFSKRKFKALEEEESQARELRSQTREQRANPLGNPEQRPQGDDKGPNFVDVNNVWKDRRRKGVVPSSSSSKRKGAEKEEKPFHSSYYYAHNSSNSKGGYADGLQMEDFDMNKPRLLSKGGKPFIEELDDDNDEPVSDQAIKETATENPSTSIKKSSRLLAQKTRVLPISKYLWDDPGEAKGVASIRIDALPSAPGSSTSDLVPWKDANVVESTAELTNGSKGLLVVVRSSDDTEYRLEIPQLYGDVTSVKAVPKAKRLLIRLQKTTGYLYKKNVEAWPLPQKKV